MASGKALFPTRLALGFLQLRREFGQGRPGDAFPGTPPRENREPSHGKIRFSDFVRFGGFLFFLWPFWDPGGFPKASQTWWDRFWLNLGPNGAVGTRFILKIILLGRSQWASWHRAALDRGKSKHEGER